MKTIDSNRILPLFPSKKIVQCALGTVKMPKKFGNGSVLMKVLKHRLPMPLPCISKWIRQLKWQCTDRCMPAKEPTNVTAFANAKMTKSLRHWDCRASPRCTPLHQRLTYKRYNIHLHLFIAQKLVKTTHLKIQVDNPNTNSALQIQLWEVEA